MKRNRPWLRQTVVGAVVAASLAACGSGGGGGAGSPVTAGEEAGLSTSDPTTTAGTTTTDSVVPTPTTSVVSVGPCAHLRDAALIIDQNAESADEAVEDTTDDGGTICTMFWADRGTIGGDAFVDLFLFSAVEMEELLEDLEFVCGPSAVDSPGFTDPQRCTLAGNGTEDGVAGAGDPPTVLRVVIDGDRAFGLAVAGRFQETLTDELLEEALAIAVGATEPIQVDPQAGDDAIPDEPCVLSDAEVGSLLGVVVSLTPPDLAAPITRCDWHGPAGERLLLQILPASMTATLADDLASSQAATKLGAQLEQVDLGEGALITTNPDQSATTVRLYVGETVYQMNIARPARASAPAVGREALELLAAKVGLTTTATTTTTTAASPTTSPVAVPFAGCQQPTEGGFDFPIRPGDSGETVRAVQELLVLLGYDIGASGADGHFGPATEAAVRLFKGTGTMADGATLCMEDYYLMVQSTESY
jgi:hypothetical protein